MLTAVTFVYRGAPLTDISLNWPTVGSMCQANNPSCPPTQYRIAPKATATIMARVAFSMASVVLVKWMGAVHANMATLTVSVNKMDTVVLMATIWPNLAKGTMTQKRRGTVEIAVVTALDTMATPTWLTASRVHLHFSLATKTKQFNMKRC